MNWNLLKLRPKPQDNSKRSEEVSDIIDRMPTYFGRWVAIAIIVFTNLTVCFRMVYQISGCSYRRNKNQFQHYSN